MKFNNALTVFCLLFALLFQPAQAMWSRRALIPTGLVAASLASHYQYNRQNGNKALGLLDNREFSVRPFSAFEKDDRDHLEHSASPTRHHVQELYKKTFPERSFFAEDHERYEVMIHELLETYFSDVWSNPCKKLHKQLTQALLFLTYEEEERAETHYPLYHGTDRLFPMVLRTLMAQHFQNNSSDGDELLLQLRSQGLMEKASDIQDPYRYAQNSWHQACEKSLQVTLNQMNPGLGSFKYNMPAASFNDPEFLAVNTAIMANVGSMTRNSLRFITPCPIDNSLGRVVFPWLYEANGGKPAALSQVSEMKKVFEEYGIADRFTDYQEKIEALCAMQVGVLLQILVPKSAAERLIVCNSSNSPVSPHAIELLERAQAGDLFAQKALEVDHLCMPMDQALFGDVRGGVRMKAVVFGDQEKISQGLQFVQEMATELSRL